MTEIITEARRIDHRQALADYLALGSRRSLAKLHQHHAKTTPKAPSIDVLKYWSRKFGWRKAAAEYDDRVAARVAAKVEQAAVKRDFDLVKELDNLVEHGVEAIRAQLADPEIVGIFRTPQDIAAAVNALSSLIKTRELILGRPTARLDMGHRIEPPAWMRQMIEESRSVALDENAGQVIEHQPVKPEELN